MAALASTQDSDTWSASTYNTHSRSSLKEEEEILLQVIMSQDLHEQAGNRNLSDHDLNPYSIPGHATADTAEVGGSEMCMSEIDSRIADLALDHDWDADGSMTDCSTMSVHTHLHGPLSRQGSLPSQCSFSRASSTGSAASTCASKQRRKVYHTSPSSASSIRGKDSMYSPSQV